MTRKHLKTAKPTDADLRGNPLIGGSKGVRMAQATPEDLAKSQGVNTVEGDVENDVNRHGGVNKRDSRNQRRAPHI